MWRYLEGLPAEFSFVIIILLIISIVIIALRGHLKAKFDKKEVEIGKEEKKEGGSGDSPITVPSTPPVHKRTCGDCILLIMGEREKYEARVKQEYERILKTQMNYVEQKLLEIQSSFMKRTMMTIHSKSNNPNAIDEAVQYKLAYGLFRDSIFGVKDELRRSFKANGFYDLDNSDFILFVRDQMAVINSILNQYIRNMYPERSGLISQEEVIDVLDKEKESLLIIFTDIYSYARTVKSEAYDRIEILKEEFSQTIDDFIHG